MSTFTEKDIQYFESKGIPVQLIEQQIENFRRGFPFTRLIRPATPGDGIEVLSPEEVDSLIRYYDDHSGSVKKVKFVPASGAASRMFKNLFEFLEAAAGNDPRELLERDKGFNAPWNFITNIRKFAFYEDLREVMRERGLDLDREIEIGNFHTVISALVTDEGLDYGSLPKGLLKFHHYGDRSRAALEEHLVEAALYAAQQDGVAAVHFTVSPEHMDKFKAKVGEIVSHYEKDHGIRFEISYSIQKPSTDTIAVDMDNNPFREPDGTILFRPAGHGALIENLGELEGDLIFIKNIDNVVPDPLKPVTTKYKKVIGGLLLRLQAQTFKYLEMLDGGERKEELLTEIASFARNELKIAFPGGFESLSAADKRDLLFNLLNRPIRICGMVRNEGEPGGGPFWVEDSRGQVSLQVVESSQIDMKDPGQAQHLRGATHFNPVDLVCGIRDFRGNKFDLHRFVDPQTGFISVKSKGGKDLKAQELPGLWNGAMADWITLFVEVPIDTFNPVKTVNDLLRKQHQPE